jgi:hypothetical protein
MKKENKNVLWIVATSLMMVVTVGTMLNPVSAGIGAAYGTAIAIEAAIDISMVVIASL